MAAHSSAAACTYHMGENTRQDAGGCCSGPSREGVWEPLRAETLSL